MCPCKVTLPKCWPIKATVTEHGLKVGLANSSVSWAKPANEFEHFDDSHCIGSVDANTEAVAEIAEVSSDAELYLSTANAWNYECEFCLKNM